MLKAFFQKLENENIPKDAIRLLIEDPSYLNLMKTAIDAADAVTIGDNEVSPELVEYAKQSGKPFLEYQTEEKNVDSHKAFYDQF